MADALQTFISILLPIAMVACGSVVVTMKKLQFQQIVPGKIVKPHPFRKPCFQVLMLQFAETLCLIWFACIMCYRKRKEKKRSNALLENEDNDNDGNLNQNPQGKKESKAKFILLLCVRMLIPAILDLCCSISASFAILLAPPSLMEVLTCSIIIFSPFWNILFLKRRYNCYQVSSVLIALAGAALASCSSLLTPSKSGENPVLGVILMLIGQLASSFQYVIEEKLMFKRRYEPALAMGTEGCLGIVMMVILLTIFQVIPGKENGSVENTLDSFVQISNSSNLQIFIPVYTAAAHCFLFSGINVTRRFSSLHRVLLSACKAALVWIIQLILHPATGGKTGEVWKTDSSLMQLFGFLTLITGNVCFQVSTARKMKQMKLKQKEAQQQENEAQKLEQVSQQQAQESITSGDNIRPSSQE
ncbi:putative transmembrane protein C2orf18 [Monocercomonoides exilis]|uniref:putative transmembrane protein C2orf18 n=1 Tax=Monocercomonoides exilis TaxID=2049356 RepID=UPI00355A67E9|nr:putative transmembrane protein C2orf18 [Monocercomonoides exilis]|eukprot:MONOS_6944.1-p1 / transcript=MONOS_6944.1 / gene=MONOS_6944 / organism=Monocercomonoides_exilis_PA203 / gene_product=transmembrane protein C2orf18 / transcript_product=transmembrane protein C2orf18 / location=Mono_scaffold00228:44359-45721(+) / protein_length=416 / sequence_SO=supercontig / SO=protein_coding / is_pseudo=false